MDNQVDVLDEAYIETDSLNLLMKNIIKRSSDIVFGIVGTLVLIPLFIIVKIAYLLNHDYAPIIFKQDRIGKGGKTIQIYKFRSMIPNAEAELERMMRDDEKIRNEYLTNKKLRNDPRITKVGKFIRKTSIDEFPQFINILKGDMALVGPRPYLWREREDMKSSYKEIIKVKPGLTGPWQVSGRSDLSFKRRLRMDRNYVNSWGIKTDVIIILKTFIAVFKHDGAE